VLRDNRYYYRRRVPGSLKAIVGKGEVWRSLDTDSLSVARRRSHQIAASVEQDFEVARQRAEMAIDTHLLMRPTPQPAVPIVASSSIVEPVKVRSSLREAYDAYMADPTRDWSPRTRMAYETTRRLALAILGEDTPIRSITRAQCRELIDVLRWLPSNASKRFPGVGPVEIAARAKAEHLPSLISPANINTYLNKLCGVFNWAAKEELIDRNPALGLKVPDPTLRRDKREPFSTKQLRAIFSAPLYTGCRDDEHGYATPGPNRPRNARFWIPLVGMFAGLRLNEACQLDVGDIRIVEGVACFAITASANTPTSDKRLKTASSERLVPVHPELLALGFMDFVAQRTRSGNTKLFGEVALGVTGYRSATFSAWFARFCAKAGASTKKTCYHSFRHVFRDALREGHVERDIALALGGWTRPGGSGGLASVSDAYGSGYRVGTLFDAIGKVRYPDIDLSHLYPGAGP
jgi:integrase